MLQTKFTTNHNKLPFSLNYSTNHPHLVAWLLGCFTSILEIIGTSIKKGKMMIYEDEEYLNECLYELPRATYSDGTKYMKKQRIKPQSAWFVTQEQREKAYERRMRR